MKYIRKNFLKNMICVLLAVISVITAVLSVFPEKYSVPAYASEISEAEDCGIITEDSEIWVASEASFESPVSYKSPFYDVDYDFVFTNIKSGTTLTVPAFWDGDQSFKVRYSLTELGEWSYKIICSDAENPLNNRGGSVICKEYTGEHEIYKRGFLKAENRYFTYADGTPFFYLGDTHWHMVLEDIDTKEDFDGVNASRFEYTLLRRKELGFTVIQSEPLGEYFDGDNSYFKKIFTTKFDNKQLERFKQYDKYFKMIADMGFVHANAQFSYPTALGKAMDNLSDGDLKRLCRYWVARYGAYPVLWTLSQECDNDYYNDAGSSNFTAENNPWKKVAVYIHKYDTYKHPLSAHQENCGNTLASNSAFRDVEGHNWWAAQINYTWGGGTLFDIYKDYWYSGQSKPCIEYEGAYDHFWTGTNGARLQGWIAFLNGAYGYGYGSQSIWSANTKPGIWAGALPESVNSGVDILRQDQLDITWQESLDLPAAKQLKHMKKFFKGIEWWNLTPCFDNEDLFSPDSNTKKAYSAAKKDDELLVAYFYNKTLATGAFTNLTPGQGYICTWYNPMVGEYDDVSTTVYVDNEGSLQIGEKPHYGDWVVSLVKDTDNVRPINTPAPDEAGSKTGCKSAINTNICSVLALIASAVVVMKRRKA